MSIDTKLLEEDLTEFCISDSLSEDGLREIIERYGVAPNNNDVTNYGFFHLTCRNGRVTEGILRFLLEYFPNAVRYTDDYGCMPLHTICANKNITLGMVQLLVDAYPGSLRHQDNNGTKPLHDLCCNIDLDKEIGLDILKLLIKRYPESVRHTARDGVLPIHFAAAWQSPEFCRLLIEAYPGSERMTDNFGRLPFHVACQYNTVATAKYLYQLYPESVHEATNIGAYPIHYTIEIEEREDNPATAVEIIQFLLDCDPNVVLQKYQDVFSLYWVCNWAKNENTPRLNAYLKVLQILYDAYPEAIEDNEVTSNVGEFCAEVQTFLNTQLPYARQARDRTLMNTRDENGQLPLHKALYGNTNLGSIKLLVKGNPSAITCADSIGMMPLHIACWHHESASVVDYLIKLDPTSLRAIDFDHNTALHYACRCENSCRGANHAIIALLLDQYGSMSVSKRNTHGQLPIDLLLRNNHELSDREDVEYIESIFRLLRAYPATVMNCIPNTTTTTNHPDSKMSGKKRKIDNIQEGEEGEGYYYSYLSSVRRKFIRFFSWGR